MMRMSAAPSNHAGTSPVAMPDRVVSAVARCARLSSDWSSELISCWRITTYDVAASTAIVTPSTIVVSTATRDASDRR